MMSLFYDIIIISSLLYNVMITVYHRMSLVETIPTNLTYNGSSNLPHHLSTFDAWNMLMSNTDNTLNIASYYWTLRGYGNSSGPTDQLVIVANGN